MQKAMGDFSLLAGSPTDAADHYGAAIELARNSMDHIWLAASFIGLANAKVSLICCLAVKLWLMIPASR